jgi:hypothetical protein
MPTSNSEPRFVLLHGGLAVPIDPLLLLLDLERRGFRVAAHGDDTLVIGPRRALTPDDCARIRQWKDHLLALVAYRAPETVQ